jgi:hypothetical protein
LETRKLGTPFGLGNLFFSYLASRRAKSNDTGTGSEMKFVAVVAPNAVGSAAKSGSFLGMLVPKLTAAVVAPERMTSDTNHIWNHEQHEEKRIRTH